MFCPFQPKRILNHVKVRWQEFSNYRKSSKTGFTMFFFSYLQFVDWRPMDDPVLSGVTQTCVTKLEGEVMVYVSLVLIYHMVIIIVLHWVVPENSTHTPSPD